MTVVSKHPKNNLLLALEGSGEAVSIALIKHLGLVKFKQHNTRFGHSEHLVDMVQAVMREAGATFSDLTHIAAGCGPGSFTGLRVCLSAAKGYALATSATPLGVNGLAALALATIADDEIVPVHSGPLICFADTRRNSLFAQAFDQQASMLSPVRDVPLDQISAYIEQTCECFDWQSVILTGHVTDLAELAQTNKRIICQQRSVDAKMIAHYVLQSMSSPQLYPCTGIEPLYVVGPTLGPARRRQG